MKKLLLKLFGKRIADGFLEKSGISKAKVSAFIFGALIILEQAFGVNVPPELKELLAAFGLWAIRDGMDAPRVIEVEVKKDAAP